MKRISKCGVGALAALGVGLTSIAVYNSYVSVSTAIKNKRTKKDSFYPWRYGDVHYTVKGSGTPVVLIHSLSNGASLDEWGLLIDKLSETNTVYALELLGFGYSDKPNITYSSYLYVSLIIDFIKDIAKCADIHTYGGSYEIAHAAKKMRPDLINKIICHNPSHTVFSRTGRLFGQFLELPFLGTFCYNLMTSKLRQGKAAYLKSHYQPLGAKLVVASRLKGFFYSKL